MKKILQGVVALIALGVGAPAFAADLPPAPAYKTPVMTPAYYDWSGFYVGLNAGGGSSHECWDNNSVFAIPTVPSVREGCHNATGALAGGQLGFRWQSGGWVFGVEAQGDWASFKGNNASIPVAALIGFPVLTNQTKVDALGLFTGQVGYAWNNVLWYVKGGARRHRQCLQRPDHRHQRGRQLRARNPLGRRGRHRRRNRLRAGLVGRYRVRPFVHGQPQHQFLRSRRWGHAQRPHHAGRRHRHCARELSLGRPGDCKILIIKRSV